MKLQRRQWLRRAGLASVALAASRAAQPATGTCVAMPAAGGVLRHYVNIAAGQIHYLSAAPPRLERKFPPLVCFHPSPTSGEMYQALQTLLATDRIVHCPDTPGYGNSTAPAAKPNIGDYGAALAASLDAQGYGALQPVDLFGFHTGSLCALEVALQRPQAVRRVVLSGIPHFNADERAVKRQANVPGYPYFTDRDYVGRLYQRLVLDAVDSGTPEQRLRRFGERLRAGPDGWWGPDAVFTYDSPARLPQLRAPSLVIVFNEEMTEPSRAAAKLLPRAELIEMLDLPIFGFIVAPQRVADAVRRFLG
jgi:pimeloyl-ACP methyl ester carboxylesterase